MNDIQKKDTANAGFMAVDSIEQAMKVATIIAESNFCPTAMKNKPGDVVVALQMGQELGLKPMQALQNIAIINGRPSLYGDAMLAVCRMAHDFQFINETYDDKSQTAKCVVKRTNEPEVIRTFSAVNAKNAGLWGKAGPWTMYKERMLQMRARGFALRDAFPDMLRGIISDEEARDYPEDRGFTGHVVDVTSNLSNENEVEVYSLGVILNLVEETGSDVEKLLAYFGVSEMSELNDFQMKKAYEMLTKKLSEPAKQFTQADDLAEIIK